eukprot:3257063-Alexandrium_andersonii.AAC.1
MDLRTDNAPKGCPETVQKASARVTAEVLQRAHTAHRGECRCHLQFEHDKHTNPGQGGPW